MPPAGGPISTSPIASEDIYLQLHLKAAIEALWSHFKGNWEELMGCLKAELSEVVSEWEWEHYCIKLNQIELKYGVVTFLGSEFHPENAQN